MKRKKSEGTRSRLRGEWFKTSQPKEAKRSTVFSPTTNVFVGQNFWYPTDTQFPKSQNL